MENLKKRHFFIVPGFQKSGTTYLHRMLIQHPEVFLTKKKELDHFSREKNILDYTKEFRNINNEKYYGDISPQYLYKNKVAKKIREYRPDTKFIILIRDPADRILSHISMDLRRNKLSGIKEILEEREDFIRSKYYEYTRYSHILEDYFNEFPLENFLFIDSKKMQKDPGIVLLKIESFLGIKNFSYKNLDKETHKGGNARIKNLSNIIRKMESIFKPHKNIIEKLIPINIISRIIFKIETEWNISNKKRPKYQKEREKITPLLEKEYRYIESLKRNNKVNFIY